MTTTAHHRTLARNLAAGLHWRAAAYHMRQAIALYPPLLVEQAKIPGTLAHLDLAAMNRRVEEWERMADEVGEPAYVLVEGELK